MKKELSPLFIKTIIIVQSIPKGKVLTYAGVAELANSPGSARYVSFILSSSSKKYDLPWHRVINSQGKVSEHLGQIRQKKRLEKEGVKFEGGQLQLSEYLWRPSKAKLKSILKTGLSTKK